MENGESVSETAYGALIPPQHVFGLELLTINDLDIFEMNT